MVPGPSPTAVSRSPAQAVSCFGIDCSAGTGYTGMALAGATSKMDASVHPNAMTLAIWSFDVLGSVGTDGSAAPRVQRRSQVARRVSAPGRDVGCLHPEALL